MRSQFKIYVSAALLMLAGASANAQTTAQKKQAEAFLTSAMVKEHIPGLAYAVIKKGTVIHTGVFGKANLSWNEKVTPSTVFQVASVSKVFCGVLLARLFDAGVLKPEQKLSELIKDIPETWNDITIIQLASHESGIKMASFGSVNTSDEALALAKKQDFQFKPGENTSYMSSDFWVLQYIIEKKTGMLYFDALRTYVLEPLHMTNTNVTYMTEGMARTSDVLPNEATVYHYNAGNGKYRVGDFPFMASGYAAGGVLTSITDFAKLACALDSKTFLSPASSNLVRNMYPTTSGGGYYGLGTIVRNYKGHKIVEHSGGPALADFTRFDDEQLTVIVLANQRGFYPYLAKSVASFYIPGLKKQEVPKDYVF